ncbi:2-oxoglutarate dehydrogenase complex dihydrolipoyllysine-residue succinyltransferase [Gorillibacterium timonense]|uniref:2-oxoglutarate dehydrogenase complex dihydrolipoyllysine-residue succinyltransferase n=1 Tax=Gorillibacterium timonense TaxID=1689269 RepID=UPI00071CD94C|nr:2-oxoglutarate dehydrogenase complex dihydrolipoyllysine-residue succinyltransferase [Gorillibacterium timonense]
MEIKIPELGESITEGTIAKWLTSEGESVRFGDALLELETDKVNVEITAEADGTLDKIIRREGETVAIGEAVGIIRPEGATLSVTPEEAGSTPGKVAAPAQKPPATQTHGRIDETETASGSLYLSKEGISSPSGAEAVAPPSIRRLAREKGITTQEARLLAARGHEPGALIAAERELKPGEGKAAPAPEIEKVKTASVVDSAATEKPVERIRMTRRRQTIAARLVQAQQTAAMLTTFNEVDMTAILDIRKRRKQEFHDRFEVGLGFMSFFTKAVIGALKRFPLLNAEIDGTDILVKKYYDIGIAVSAEEGLVVPVVRDADRLSFADIEKRIAELAGRARSNTLSLNDLNGGTFTITNGGIFGSLLSTPILNAPQVGILGMHTIQRRPVAIDEERMANRPMMYIALSYDHRIVDGSEAVRFLRTVKELLEDPEKLLLEG